MADKNRGQSGGVNISGGKVSVGGDIVGRDKKTTVSYGLSESSLREVSRIFEQILRSVDASNTVSDKTKVKRIVGSIEHEIKKGEEAETSTVKDWLLSLAEMADDIYQITVLALANPIAGVAKGIQTLARRLKQERTTRS